VTVEAASCIFICHDVLADPFMADPKDQVHLEPYRNLFRTPVLANEELDQSPGVGSNWLFGFPTSLPCYVMYFFGPAAAKRAVGLYLCSRLTADL
jgi:hypothetical protein